VANAARCPVHVPARVPGAASGPLLGG
jgi:hypothetical protein